MNKPSYERLSEIATLLLDGLLQDDESEAFIYLKETVNLSEEECEYFDIDYANLMSSEGFTNFYVKSSNNDLLSRLIRWEDGKVASSNVAYVLFYKYLLQVLSCTWDKAVGDDVYTISVYTNGLLTVTMNNEPNDDLTAGKINKVFGNDLQTIFGDCVAEMPVIVCDRKFNGKPYFILSKRFENLKEHLNKPPYKHLQQLNSVKN